jgi:hypothetical protein
MGDEGDEPMNLALPRRTPRFERVPIREAARRELLAHDVYDLPSELLDDDGTPEEGAGPFPPLRAAGGLPCPAAPTAAGGP